MIDEKKLIEEIENTEIKLTGLRSMKTLILECLDSYKEMVLKTINDQPKVGEWIPCSERLPEVYLVRDIFKRPQSYRSNKVLVTVKSEECDGVYYYVSTDVMCGSTLDRVDWLMSCGYGGSAVYKQEIIAWQPLPELYKGD